MLALAAQIKQIRQVTMAVRIAAVALSLVEDIARTVRVIPASRWQIKVAA